MSISYQLLETVMRISYLANLPQGLRDSVVMTGGVGAATLLSAAAGIMISRLLGPVGFGEFSVGISLAFILAKVNDLGLMAAQLKFVPTRTRHDETVALFSYVIRKKLSISFFILVVGWLASPFLIALLKFSNPPIIYASFLINPVSVLFEQLVVMLQSLRLVKETVVASAIQASTKLVVTLWFWILKSTSSLMMFIGYLAAPVTALAAAAWLLPSWFALGTKAPAKKIRRQVWQLARHSLVFYLSLGIVDNLDVLLVEGFLPAGDTGLYSGAARISLLFVMMSYSLAAVLNPRVARYTTKQHLGAYLRKVGLFTAGLVVVTPFLMLTAKGLILFSIGPEYLAAILTLQILLVTAVITILTALLTALFFSYDNAEWYFSVFGVLQLILLVGLTVVLIPQFGLEGAAWARLLTKGILLLFTLGVASLYYARVPATAIKT